LLLFVVPAAMLAFVALGTGLLAVLGLVFAWGPQPLIKAIAPRAMVLAVSHDRLFEEIIELCIIKSLISDTNHITANITQFLR
jgi:hypothetical protein